MPDDNANEALHDEQRVYLAAEIRSWRWRAR
jgi:hypothetical protein